MTISVVRGLHAAVLTGALVLTSSLALAAEPPIKLGVLEDQSGDFSVATIGKVHAIQLAADEINKAGGIMGRPLELVIYDTQSDNTRYQEFMRRVLQRDKVDAVFAGFSSASREAYRPIVDQLNGLAFYNNQYEGGVCDGHMIVTGAVLYCEVQIRADPSAGPLPVPDYAAPCAFRCLRNHVAAPIKASAPPMMLRLLGSGTLLALIGSVTPKFQQSVGAGE